MRIQRGDTVKMLKGKDRGRTGKVVQIFSGKNRVIVEGLNLVKKHVRKRGEREEGGIVSAPRTVSVSAVQLVCPKCSKATRVMYKVEKSGAKTRVCKKCESVIDNLPQKAEKKKGQKK